MSEVDRLDITLSAEVTKIIRREIERQIEFEEKWEREQKKLDDEKDQAYRDLGLEPPACKPYEKKPPQTPQEIVERAIRMSYEPRGEEDWETLEHDLSRC